MIKKKISSLLLAVIFIVGAAAGGFAASNLKEIKAFLRTEFNTLLNGKNSTDKDAKGNKLYPISYNDTIYLPSSNMDKIDVDYSLKENNKTISLKNKFTIDNSIKYEVNGIESTLKDINGNKLETINYDGHYYIPLEALPSVLKIAMELDKTKNTAIIGKREGNGVPLISLKSTVYNKYGAAYYITKTTDKNTLTFNKKDGSSVSYNNGLICRTSGFSDPVVNLSLSLGGKFQNLSLNAWADKVGYISILDTDNDIEVGRVSLTGNEIVENLKFDVAGVNNIKVVFMGTAFEQKVNFAITEPYLN